MAKKKVVKKRVVYRVKKELPRMYRVIDQILPDLNLPNPVAISITVTARDVQLIVGPRDWQWDRKTGDMVGAGTSLDDYEEAAAKQEPPASEGHNSDV